MKKTVTVKADNVEISLTISARCYPGEETWKSEDYAPTREEIVTHFTTLSNVLYNIAVAAANKADNDRRQVGLNAETGEPDNLDDHI